MTSSFHGILVPLDGSPLAEQALPVAVELGRRSGAVLHLATVAIPLSAAAPQGPEGATAAAPGARRRWQEYLEAHAEALRTTRGLDVACAVLDGSPAIALARYARGKKIDLTVMTTHGRGGFSRLWLGSVADRLLRHLPTPLLVLHPQERPPAAEFRHIVVGLDGHPDSEAVLEPAIALGGMTKARYTLVRVLDPLVPILPLLPNQVADPTIYWDKDSERLAAQYLERLADPLRMRGLTVETRVVIGSGVAGQLLQVARETGGDLVAVCTRSKRGVERLLLGSVADKVIRGADRLVLAVPLRATRKRPAVDDAAAAGAQPGPAPPIAAAHGP